MRCMGRMGAARVGYRFELPRIRGDETGMSVYALKNVVRHHIKAALGRFCIYRLSKKPIFIFAYRRGGSTLLMRMLYSQPGLDYIGEPLDFYNYHPHRHRLPQPYQNRFISLEPCEEKLFFDYWKDLLAGRCRLKNQWNVFDPDFSFYVDRLVIKELYAKPLIDWFCECFDVGVIYLIRHPVPLALSILRNRTWGNKVETFLGNTYFRETFLDGDKEMFCRHILASGSPLQQHVLEWCLENLYPLSVYRQRPWLFLTYEELVLRPRQVSSLICSRFDLPDAEHMHKTVLRPTRTAWGNSKNDIRTLGPAHRSGRWVTEVTPQEVERVRRMLEVFEIKAYEAHKPYPARELCHFGPLQNGG